MDPYNTIDRYTTEEPRDLGNEYDANRALRRARRYGIGYHGMKNRRINNGWGFLHYVLALLAGASIITVVTLTTAVLMGY